MSNSSVQRELEEIEHRRKLMDQYNSGCRRGSSIFAAVDDSESGPYGRPSYLTKSAGDDLLVDFPESKAQGSYSTQASDISYNSQHSDGVMMTGVISGNTKNYNNRGQQPRLGEAARMQQLANSQDLPGGINHRPLVGGFAAAAYEAARAHHYSAERETKNIPRDRRPPPPSI